MKHIATAALAAATVLAVTSVASSSPSPPLSRDEAALAPTRVAPSRGIEAKVDALLAKMTTD
jgi:beta-glucosidase